MTWTEINEHISKLVGVRATASRLLERARENQKLAEKLVGCKHNKRYHYNDYQCGDFYKVGCHVCDFLKSQSKKRAKR